MPVIIDDERAGGSGVFADTIFESNKSLGQSRLLGPDGSLLAYAATHQPIGFDLTPHKIERGNR